MLLNAQLNPLHAGLQWRALRWPSDRPVAMLFLVAAAIFLCADARTAPFTLWDESRNIVNALEMRRTGFSLVTTYGFEPDLWNTKPPLLIWLMMGSVALFGPAEWALRLPSLVASLGTLALLLWFTRRVTGSLGTALFAGAMLLLSPAFFAGHAAHTADYDALLTFFTTGYLFALFFAVTRSTPRSATLALAGLSIAGAVLAKSSAGLIPGAGVAAYLLFTRRLPRVWAGPGYWLMAAVAAGPVLAFYLAREAAGPGYLQAVLHNELFGRFNQSLIGRDEPAWFYVTDMLRGWFFAGPLLLLAPLGWSEVRGKSRALLVYCLCVSLTLLAVLSTSSTKLPHYLLPAYPPLAIAAALLLRGAYQRVEHVADTRLAGLALALFAGLSLTLLTARAAYWRIVSLPAQQITPAAHYGALFAGLASQSVTRAVVVDPGFRLDGWPAYAPVLRSYQLLWAERGLVAERGHMGEVLASCDPLSVSRLLAVGQDFAGVPNCAAVRPNDYR